MVDTGAHRQQANIEERKKRRPVMVSIPDWAILVTVPHQRNGNRQKSKGGRREQHAQTSDAVFLFLNCSFFWHLMPI